MPVVLYRTGGGSLIAASDYESLRAKTSWDAARRELGLAEHGPVNIGWLCTDRIVEQGRGEKTALLHENHAGEVRRFSFRDLSVLSNGWADYLAKQGVRPRDRVCLFLDRVPELYISFLGILKAGAVVEPLFSAFGTDALLTRMEDSRASAVITQRKHLAKVRKIREKLPDLKVVIVIDHDADGKPLQEGEVAFRMEDHRLERFTATKTFAETPSVLHYTSGTTGKPKGALHVHGSVVAQYLTTQMVLDVKDDDIYWCTADPGWVTGTSYGIIGPWSMGATQVVLDAGFSSERWYKTIEKHRITVWYTAPTAIRMLMKDGLEPVRACDLSSLRHLASVGEPLNAEAVHWGREAFKLDFHDTFWQTETGCIVVTNLPGMPVKPGSMGRAFPALEADDRRSRHRRADHRARPRRDDRGAAALAQHDAPLLEQLRHLLRQVPGRLVHLRRPREPRRRRLRLVHRARRRRDQHRRPPGRAVRDRERAAGAPGGRRVGRDRQA